MILLNDYIAICILDCFSSISAKNAKANSATQGGVTDNIVELQITTKKTWGGQERTYKVYGLTGLDDNANYKLIQPLGN